MSNFSKRYTGLNDAQRQAVAQIDGPVLVIAGPGTGKTELLSVRAANILQSTDTLPENILCLTFTDSGANAMRQRMAGIIGPDAYKIAVHTFHSFGTEVINQNNEYFYRGAEFAAADELSSFEIMQSIFDELDHDNILSSKMGDDYTYLPDAARSISELKQAGVTESELLEIINVNDETMDNVEKDLTKLFEGKVSISMLEPLAQAAQKVAVLPRPELPSSITPLSNIMALSMAHAVDEPSESRKTTAITRWRNEWMEKDSSGAFVFKDRKRNKKLRTLSHIYFSYLARMEQQELYDYDDMILSVITAIETNPELKFNLQEKYQYIMVDEFQDTNLAQLRIVFDLTDNPANEGMPNIMAVGDDDQAIYSFQGADVNNIHKFRERFPELQLITLTENYRSAARILDASREVIQLGEGRLESTIEELDKTLTPNFEPSETRVSIVSHETVHEEKSWIAGDIARLIQNGTSPSSITVIARKHSELIDLIPHLNEQSIAVNYERRNNVLDIESLKAIELIARVVHALFINDHDLANSLMPELLAHPAFGFEAQAIWRLSLRSYRNQSTWLEQMVTNEHFTALAFWLIEQAKDSSIEPMEIMLDRLLGVPEETKKEGEFTSPLYDYFFSDDKRSIDAEEYLTNLDALRTIRSRLRDYRPSGDMLKLADFVEYLQIYRDLGSPITSVRNRSEAVTGAINLMTAHKAKGLEFDYVYILGAVDSNRGERVRTRSRLISYPANLMIAPAGSTYSERLRLFYVAMTRAKTHLIISHAAVDANGKAQLPASFLTDLTTDRAVNDSSNGIDEVLHDSKVDWLGGLVTNVSKKSMQELLSSTLENYKLSITHLTNFLDVTKGGPSYFLIQNILHFPSAKSPHASFGTAMHRALHHAHMHLVTAGSKRPVEDILGDFTNELRSQRLSARDFEQFNKRGIQSLSSFLTAKYDTFIPSEKTELNFAGQSVVIDGVRLTGALDVANIQEGTITVTDYKTGAPLPDWSTSGKSDYEKIKLHKYKQQLMFYQLLIANSRDYAKFSYDKGILQFVEPDQKGVIHGIEAIYSTEELEEFKLLLRAVWKCITTLELPTTEQYDSNLKGILRFEQDLIDKYTN